MNVLAPRAEILLEVWREVCRHIEIGESTANIAALLASAFPFAGLTVRRLDPTRRLVETVAQGPAVEVLDPDRAQWPTTAWKDLLRWGEAPSLAQGFRSELPAELAPLAPENRTGRLVVGPLIGPQGLAGALLVEQRSGATLEPPHLDLIRSLLEAFSAALENDRRLHELESLRAAAEADRRSLLNRLGREELADPVVGADSGLRHVMERVSLVANSDVPVLILGETGTGKEVVSRTIHQRSPRGAGPFIRVNCGAIPAELVDSQLFGHEKGSFTGATDSRPGWFERADGGTLFLDEIGELPLAAQVRLLRVLQDHTVERVGGQKSIRVDVRIIAATHRDLAAMVKTGTFREDLWYRVNVFPLLLPRLRERIEDIPALARHFARKAANRFGLPYVEPTSDDLRRLVTYTWPGNIRELGAVIDRAAILGNGQTLEIATALGLGAPAPTLPACPGPTMYEVVPESPLPVAPPREDGTIVTLDLAMKQHIERALVATNGRIEGAHGAAALLGINPHTLRARMRKLTLDWSRYRSS